MLEIAVSAGLCMKAVRTRRALQALMESALLQTMVPRLQEARDWARTVEIPEDRWTRSTLELSPPVELQNLEQICEQAEQLLQVMDELQQQLDKVREAAHGAIAQSHLRWNELQTQWLADSGIPARDLHSL